MSEFISPKQLHTRLSGKSNSKKPFLLDVRHLWEWAQGHLPHAVLIPLSELPSRLNELPSNKKTEIVTYCQHGSRAERAFSFLQSLGYKNVKLLKGSFAAWACDGFPSKK